MVASPTCTQARPSASPAPIIKAFFVGLYCAGVLSESALIELFRRHPEWKFA